MREQNVGHGHVFPRPDGVRARCGGPAICHVCAVDLARKNIGERVNQSQSEQGSKTVSEHVEHAYWVYQSFKDPTQTKMPMSDRDAFKAAAMLLMLGTHRLPQEKV